MSEPPQAGRHTLREIAASLWEDGLGDVILAIANGDVVAIGSEEMTNATIADRDDATGFLVQMDPVDGSSNIDVAAGIGSVFGIWHNEAPGPFQESSLLRPGNEQVAATYVIYGTSTILVAATRGSVQGFTLDNASGEFLLTHPDLRYPEKCEYDSANVGNFGDWEKPVQRAVIALQGQYTLRYTRVTGLRLPAQHAEGRHILISGRRHARSRQVAADVRGEPARLHR